MERERIRRRLTHVQEQMEDLCAKDPLSTPSGLLFDVGLRDLKALGRGELPPPEFLGRCAAVAYQADQLIVDEVSRKPEGELPEEVGGLLAVVQGNRWRIITGLLCRSRQLTKVESPEPPVTPALLTQIDPLFLASAYDLALLDCLEGRISLPQLLEIINTTGALAHNSAVESQKRQLYEAGLLTPSPATTIQETLSMMCQENARSITLCDPLFEDMPLERGFNSKGSYLRTIVPDWDREKLELLLDEIRLVGGTTVEEEGITTLSGGDNRQAPIVRVDFPFGDEPPVFCPPFNLFTKDPEEVLMRRVSVDGRVGFLSLSKN